MLGCDEARGQAGLVEEHRHVLRILGVAQPLDDEQLAEAGRALGDGQIEIGHASMAKLRQHSILSQNELTTTG